MALTARVHWAGTVHTSGLPIELSVEADEKGGPWSTL
jgi:hypothetical protein